MQVEKESLQSTKAYVASQTKRIEALEAAMFEEKADDQFSEIRHKIVELKVTPKYSLIVLVTLYRLKNRNNLADINLKIEEQRKDFETIQFNFNNVHTEFQGVQAT